MASKEQLDLVEEGEFIEEGKDYKEEKSHSKTKHSHASASKEPPQVQFDNLVKLFWGNNPYVMNTKKNNELEVRFGTRNIKPLTKIDYDNVIRKLKSLGFTSQNERGSYFLRINNEFLDSTSGRIKTSQIRTEITGFQTIQEYCKHNNINKLLSDQNFLREIDFYRKVPYFIDKEKVAPVNMDNFNFRVSYQTEEKVSINAGQIKNMLEKWDKTKKYFRYINRVTFEHYDLPVKVDLSIVKSSSYDLKKKQQVMAYTTDESEVFNNPEVYEIEIEINNEKIGPGTSFSDVETLIFTLRKAIKYVLMGLQGTNYPISYTEQTDILNNYMKLIMGDEYDPAKHSRVYPNSFIGPSSYTLQMKNIAPINDKTTIPNIRRDYTVTDKADGQRFMLYISNVGKIYLINNSMQIVFTGSVTSNKDIFNSLIDGENILHDKNGKYINLYAAFDIYFINKKDVRSFGFVPRKPDDPPAKFRLIILKNLIRVLNPESIITGDISPIRIVCKKFYPVNPEEDIFSACNYILTSIKDELFEYNIDGLIFTPATFGVGADKIGKVGSLHKTITWEHSFKWKPAAYNTIDFLVKTIKSANNVDVVTPIFKDGLNTSEVTQFNEYKTITLCVGFNSEKHGYVNPCQDVLEDKLPDFRDVDNEKDYRPAEFVPTNPSEPNAGICNIMLRKDETGVNQMFTEEGEVFEDGTIVEFRYDMDKQKQWRWIPLRFRSDKTAKYKLGLNEFGNAYHVANSNWHSIHNPITEEMISTGNNIPEELDDDDIYYNRVGATTDKTRAMRDFHNLFVKKILITSVSKRGETLIDYACGKGGDFSKWIAANLSFVFGIDISKDNLENRLDGACARFLNYRKSFKFVPYALFVNGNSSVNIKSGRAMLNDKAIQITKAVFGEGVKDGVEERLGKAVARQFGKGEGGFNVSSCQFALHYFFESQNTFQNFMRNVSECTKLGGYFIGACYDGKLIYNLLKSKKVGESIQLYEDGVKIWEIIKEYDVDYFDDDATSIGYEISVYQESINKLFSEYLVNFDYLERSMENYGFKLITRDEAKALGVPEGSGLFSELFNLMLDESKRKKYKKNPYESALSMTANEKKISFLNRYFIYKKVRNVNAEKITLEFLDETEEEARLERKETKQAVSVAKEIARENEKEAKSKKSKIKKLSSKLVLVAATEALEEQNEKEKASLPLKESVFDKKPKKTVASAKKVKLILKDETEAIEYEKEREREREREEERENEEEKIEGPQESLKIPIKKRKIKYAAKLKPVEEKEPENPQAPDDLEEP